MSKLIAKSAALLIFFINVFLLSGCQTVGKTLNLDTDVTLTFRASANINPDNSRKPSPLFVRFYELKSKDIFEKAEFIDLYERDNELLANDLVSKKELKRLIPGEIREDTFILNPDTKYIALFSEFYRYSDSKYRAIVSVETNNFFNDKVVVDITNNSMVIVKN